MRLHFRSTGKESIFHFDPANERTSYLLRKLDQRFLSERSPNEGFHFDLFATLERIDNNTFALHEEQGRPLLTSFATISDPEIDTLKESITFQLASALDKSYQSRTVDTAKSYPQSTRNKDLPVKLYEFASASKSELVINQLPIRYLRVFNFFLARAIDQISSNATHLLTSAPNMRNVLIRNDGSLKLIVGEDNYLGPPESELGFLLGEYMEHLFERSIMGSRQNEVPVWKVAETHFHKLEWCTNYSTLKTFAILQGLGHQMQQFLETGKGSEIEEFLELCIQWDTALIS